MFLLLLRFFAFLFLFFYSLKGYILVPKKRPDGSKDWYEWKFILPGKKGSAWENGFIKVNLSFPDDWGWSAPAVRLEDTTHIWHPNVINGYIELGMLTNVGNGWDYKITIKALAERIEKVLHEPDTSEGKILNQEAADEFDNDPATFWANVKKSVKYLSFD